MIERRTPSRLAEIRIKAETCEALASRYATGTEAQRRWAPVLLTEAALCRRELDLVETLRAARER